jgi:hypothetical protein
VNLNDVTTNDDMEFERIFQEFVAAGGLDWSDCPDEDYERDFRLAHYCKHGSKWQACSEGCKAPAPTALPLGGTFWGYSPQ